MKKVTRKEREEIWAHVESEGFGYYMLHWGPDLDLISRMGFNKTEVKKAIDLFRSIETEINKFDSFSSLEEKGSEDATSV